MTFRVSYQRLFALAFVSLYELWHVVLCVSVRPCTCSYWIVHCSLSTHAWAAQVCVIMLVIRPGRTPPVSLFLSPSLSWQEGHASSLHIMRLCSSFLFMHEALIRHLRLLYRLLSFAQQYNILYIHSRHRIEHLWRVNQMSTFTRNPRGSVLE